MGLGFSLVSRPSSPTLLPQAGEGSSSLAPIERLREKGAENLQKHYALRITTR